MGLRGRNSQEQRERDRERERERHNMKKQEKKREELRGEKQKQREPKMIKSNRENALGFSKVCTTTCSITMRGWWHWRDEYAMPAKILRKQPEMCRRVLVLWVILLISHLFSTVSDPKVANILCHKRLRIFEKALGIAER